MKEFYKKLHKILDKYGFVEEEGDGTLSHQYHKLTDEGEWFLDMSFDLQQHDDGKGKWWTENGIARYHIFFYPKETKLDKFISIFNKKHKKKFGRKDLHVEYGFDLGYGLFNNEKEFLMKLEWELKKTNKQVKEVFESIAPSNLGGMGAVEFPTDNNLGSGDIPSEKKKKKIMKTFEQFVNEKKKDNPCWDGYERVPGTKEGEKGSCRKIEEKISNPKGSKTFNNLVKDLQSAVWAAKALHRDGQKNPEAYTGTEGQDIAILLEQIWNAFSTGKPTDDLHRDEIFK